MHDSCRLGLQLVVDAKLQETAESHVFRGRYEPVLVCIGGTSILWLHRVHCHGSVSDIYSPSRDNSYLSAQLGFSPGPTDSEQSE